MFRITSSFFNGLITWDDTLPTDEIDALVPSENGSANKRQKKHLFVTVRKMFTVNVSYNDPKIKNNNKRKFQPCFFLINVIYPSLLRGYLFSLSRRGGHNSPTLAWIVKTFLLNCHVIFYCGLCKKSLCSWENIIVFSSYLHFS